MTDGSRVLPLHHLSIRVPWHDAAWNGTICQRPDENAACLVLNRIRETRKDSAEIAKAGQLWSELDQGSLPACVAERGGFMAPFEFARSVTHPYTETSKAHKHFAPTRLRFPAYSAACLPFRWMLHDSAEQIASQYEIGLIPELEERARELMGFKADWIQDRHNQVALLDTFFSAIRPDQSLCFFYAKQTPLSEDHRRVIIGVGRVTHVGQAIEYEYQDSGELRSVLWERSVQHSIRPDFRDGFLLPYHQVLELAAKDTAVDPARFVAYAPDDRWEEFAYASEHVSHDTAIASLLSCVEVLRNLGNILQGDWETPLRWIDSRINELWHMRGPCPGLGAALSAFGVDHGNLLAYYISSVLDDNEDPWPAVEQAFENPSLLSEDLKKRIGKTLSQKWRALPEERRSLLKLLSRFDVTTEQATRFYQPTVRDKARIHVSDSDLLTNPYLLYELDRVSPDSIAVSTIDRGMFPDPVIREAHPLPEPSRLEDATDPRRVRGFVVSVLEQAAKEGDTLKSKDRVIQSIRDMLINPPCPVDGDLMTAVESSFSPALKRVEMANDVQAYQLSRLADMGEIIRGSVERRLKGRRHLVEADWAVLLDEKLGGPADEEDEAEANARQEKLAGLVELAASRLSVLIGPAGTGKTTLLSVLCALPKIRNGGIILLAPTGKARVQLEKSTGLQAQTIAQFLVPLDRYNIATGAYQLSSREPIQTGRTVVIDEASMLTEEQLASVIDALTGVERLILAGDPRQLPPIGSGRPFVDIVAKLVPEYAEHHFPRVGPGYAELTIRRRQIGESRDDLLLAEWFSGQAPGAGADEIWERVESGVNSGTLSFVSWRDADDLWDHLLGVLVEELGLRDRDDTLGFEQSLGGTGFEDQRSAFFWRGRDGQVGAAEKVEEWQILSPVRGQAHGVGDLNRLIQRHFRKMTRDRATKPYRNIPRPFGPEEILYGDKVINTINQRRNDVYPDEGALRYVANGEIGIVVGQFKGRNARYRRLPWKLEVEFSSQPGVSYGYGGGDFREDGEASLELAYAITVHKAQGSEFGITFLVLPNPCWLLSRELLYTALTRQRERLVILHQGDLSELKRYAAPTYSETARRLTNLFGPPNPVQVEGLFLEDGLIHRTRRGDAVRSKSEVIIADLLFAKGFKDYQYEQRLVGHDGKVRYPDFTIEDAETGVKVYWEHLGMLHNPQYRSRWNRKLVWYREQGIENYKDGGGPAGTLIVTRDDEKGGISSEEFERIVGDVFGR